MHYGRSLVNWFHRFSSNSDMTLLVVVGAIAGGAKQLNIFKQAGDEMLE
jgi:hypothetical protein